MIIIRLMGGLGNQMFQYAFARHLSLLWDRPLKLDLSDFTSAKHASSRRYGLGVFSIQVESAQPIEINTLKSPRYLDWLHLTKATHVKEKNFGIYDDKFTHIKPPFYLDGYWQSAKYFQDSDKQIRADFQLNASSQIDQSELLDQISSTNSIALHIRRGDYITNTQYAAIYHHCSLDYYQQAAALLAQKITKPHFFIFSDDLDWVRANLKIDYPICFVANDYPDFQALILMSQCKHQIIANSSFSWWGAWLNSNPDKLIIAPKQWFSSCEMSSRDILPNSWIKL